MTNAKRRDELQFGSIALSVERSNPLEWATASVKAGYDAALESHLQSAGEFDEAEAIRESRNYKPNELHTRDEEIAYVKGARWQWEQDKAALALVDSNCKKWFQMCCDKDAALAKANEEIEEIRAAALREIDRVTKALTENQTRMMDIVRGAKDKRIAELEAALKETKHQLGLIGGLTNDQTTKSFINKDGGPVDIIDEALKGRE